METLQAEYSNAFHSVILTRDANGVLIVKFHTNGGPLMMTAQAHTEFVEAFYRIAQDRANKIVILTGAGGEFIADIDWSSFGDVADPGVWSQVHDEGVQALENLANIRVPVIAAIEGRAHVHSDYALLASVIVAAEGATFQDVAHFAAGVAPGDGIFTTWSHRAGAGRAEAFLLNPQPVTARTAQEWGVVAEVVSNGQALSRARELAELYLKAPEVTRRNTRVHFIQPLKERIVREVGYGLSLEGASSADLCEVDESQDRTSGVDSKSRMSERAMRPSGRAWSTLAQINPLLGGQPLLDPFAQVVGEDLVLTCLEGVERRADYVLGLQLGPGSLARHVCVDVPDVQREHLRLLPLQLLPQTVGHRPSSGLGGAAPGGCFGREPAAWGPPGHGLACSRRFRA